jgi:hypothetical protein
VTSELKSSVSWKVEVMVDGINATVVRLGIVLVAVWVPV